VTLHDSNVCAFCGRTRKDVRLVAGITGAAVCAICLREQREHLNIESILVECTSCGERGDHHAEKCPYVG
jgi:hypothetical protein